MLLLVRFPELVCGVLVVAVALVIVPVTLSSVTGSATFISFANTDIILKGPGFMVEVVLIVAPTKKPSVKKLPDDLDILLPDAVKVSGMAPTVLL